MVSRRTLWVDCTYFAVVKLEIEIVPRRKWPGSSFFFAFNCCDNVSLGLGHAAIRSAIYHV